MAGRAGNIVVRVSVGHGRNFDQLGSQHPERIFLFLALGFRDYDHRTIAQRLGNHGQADARIPCRPFDNDAARPQKPSLFCIADDEEPGTILHRLPRIHEFGLAENLAACFLRGPLQADQRGIADGIHNRVFHSVLFRFLRRLESPPEGCKEGFFATGQKGAKLSRIAWQSEPFRCVLSTRCFSSRRPPDKPAPEL